MRKHIHKISILLIILATSVSWAQERDGDTLKTDVIHVVKPYTPTISDAFKVKEQPVIDDAETNSKKEVEYNIFSFPVASTFTPAKGKAALVDKEKPAKLYNNYASLGLGSYTSILADVYLSHALSKTDNISGSINHHSSQGGIDKALLDDKFYNTNLDLGFSRKERNLSWNVAGGFKHQMYNWYGLPQPYFDTSSPEANMDVNHTFYGGNLGGDIAFKDTYFKSASLMFRHFGDDYGSSENRLKLKGSADIPIADFEISTQVTIDYLAGSFERSYNINSELKYGNFNIGLAPTYRIVQDDLTLDLGVSLYYLNNIESGENKFFVYPNIAASYRVVDEVLIAYGGVKGGLIQNSYEGFAEENKFVSPTLFVTPTDQQYHAYVGLKGKVSKNVSYNIKGAYYAEKDKSLFRNNERLLIAAEENYQFGNSFGVVYDDVSTFNIGGEISVDMNQNFTLGFKADYFAYNVDKQSEAWNLPSITGSLFMDYQIDQHWFAGASLFYVGEREDRVYSVTFPTVGFTNKTLDSYFDANAHVGYHVNDRLSVFAKANNIASQDYQKWLNYPVQGIQILAGATYKFDF